MILVFGSELDPTLRAAIDSWEGAAAIVATPTDLCTRGWSVRTDALADATLVADGRPLAVSHVDGVVNLLPAIGAHELFDIDHEARVFAAAEATAFLTFLLTVLPCKVINRPSSECLLGPNWRPEQWAMACRFAGLGVRTVRRDSLLDGEHKPGPAVTSSVVMVDGEPVGDAPPEIVAPVRRLAERARTSFIKVNLTADGARETFHSAELVPDVKDPLVRGALTASFAGPRTR